MKPEMKVWLYDIIRSIEEIDSYFEGSPRVFDDFKNDLKTQRAVERNLEIIGEALNRILRSEPGLKISNSRKIVDTRNRIIHGYDTITVEIVWGIIMKHLPVLKQEISDLLND